MIFGSSTLVSLCRVATPVAMMCGLMLLWGAPALAQAGPGAQSLRDALFGNDSRDGRARSVAKVADYVTDDGDHFVLDRSSDTVAYLRFEEQAEVWALWPSSGPRGDVIYKNDVGTPVLRATRWGGFVLFTAEKPMGIPVALGGPAEVVRYQRLSNSTLNGQLQVASQRLGRLLDRNIVINSAHETPGAEILIADTAQRVIDAVARIAKRPTLKKTLSRFRDVRIQEGSHSDAIIDDGVLVVTIQARQSWAGRPSSLKISRAIAGVVVD